jgi:hypothetical protein
MLGGKSSIVPISGVVSLDQVLKGALPVVLGDRMEETVIRREAGRFVGISRVRAGDGHLTAHVRQPTPPVRLLLVFPDASLVRAAVRTGIDVRVLACGAQRHDDFPLAQEHVFHVAECGDVGAAEAGSHLISEHGVTHVLDAEGFPAHGGKPAGGSEAEVAPYLLADVRAVRLALSSSSRAVVREHTVADAGEVPSAVADLGGAVTISTGAEEYVVETANSLDEWVRTHPPEQFGGPFLIEELIAGTEVVVTTLTVNGMHRVIGITGRYPMTDRTEYVYPASLAEIEARRIRAAVTGMLDLVGYEFGPAQTRVALTGGGPRIVSSVPAFSVHGIAALIETATGFDVRTELFRALAGAPMEPPRPRWFAAAEVAGYPENAVERAAGHSRGRLVALRGLAEGVSSEAARMRLGRPRDPRR